MPPSQGPRLDTRRLISRRALLGAAGSAAAAVGLAGCSGFIPSSGSDAGPAPSGGSGSDQTLNFTTWGTDAELAGFRAVIASFEKANAGAKVTLNAVPYAQMFTNIDTLLQAGTPPDVFRVPYYTFGGYAGRGQLLDLSSRLPAGFGSRFTPAAWAAVQNAGRPFGVPHHTDTSVIFYNKTALDQLGITNVPTTLDTAWTWDEFRTVLTTLRSKLPADKYPYVANWQGNGVTRWLTWLFEAGGRMLASDLVTPGIDSSQAREAIDYTRSFFAQNLVPPNGSVKSTTLAADTWYTQTAVLSSGGAFQIPDAVRTVKFEWGTTFSPRKVRAASDFGGNALVATAAARHPDLAAAFLDHVTGADQMRAFCAASSLLPTRADLVASGIQFEGRPELSPVFIGQASTVRPEDSAQVASPSMSKIITVLKDQLELAFVGGQSTDATAVNLATGIGAATR